MLERTLVDFVMRRLLRHGRVSITYWNGEVASYVGKEGTDEPWLKVTIAHPRVVWRLLTSPSLAVGEGYVSGELKIAESQLELFFRLIAVNQPRTSKRQPAKRWVNERERQRSFIETHYNVGNEYYALFLDPTLTYSCAYFANPDMGLEAAQYAKVHHVLRKLQLQPGMHLLDIGCGWGHLAVEAAKTYGVYVLGITLSSEQLKGARALAEREGVSHLVTFELMNYQDLRGMKFDRIVSVGMYEHVGRGNRDQYFVKVYELLAIGGISVLHTITQQTARPVDAWIDKYIFPGGYLPTVAEIEEGLVRRGFWSVDRENLWWHYAETLRYWRQAHQQHRDQIVRMLGEDFYLMRDFWLAGSESGFRYGQLGLTQLVFTKGKPRGGSWPATREYMYK